MLNVGCWTFGTQVARGHQWSVGTHMRDPCQEEMRRRWSKWAPDDYRWRNQDLDRKIKNEKRIRLLDTLDAMAAPSSANTLGAVFTQPSVGIVAHLFALQ